MDTENREIEGHENVKGGPANHHTAGGLDAPTPPGGPLRQDAPDGPLAGVQPVEPVEPAEPDSEPEVRPSSPPEGPGTIPPPAQPQTQPETQPETQPDPAQRLQRENAESSQGEPSVAVE